MNPGLIIKTALGSLVSNRVYANTFPQQNNNPTWPAIRFTVVGGEVFADLCGSEDWQTDDARVQLDVVALEYDQMRSLVQQVISAMGLITDPPVRRSLATTETFDSETKTHRSILEYTFHPSSPEESP
jgi:hypothetical protein